MNNSDFDTLTCAKKLKKAGFTDEQAAVQVEMLLQIIDILSKDRKVEPVTDRDLEPATKGNYNDLKHTLKMTEYSISIRLGLLIFFSAIMVTLLTK